MANYGYRKEAEEKGPVRRGVGMPAGEKIMEPGEALRVRLGHRANMEEMLEDAAHLPDKERLLLLSYFDDKMSIYELAKACGTTRHVLRRRMVALIDRVSHPLFRATVKYADQLPEEIRATAKAHFIKGVPIAKIAKQQGIRYRVAQAKVEQAKFLLVSLALREAGLPKLASMFS